MTEARQPIMSRTAEKKGDSKLKENGEVPRTTVADVEIMEGMYTSVLLAAFGRITIELGPKEHHKCKVHPFFLLILCVPLFVMQLSAILALRVDMNWQMRVGQLSNSNILAPLKLLMIFIVQLLSFKYLTNSLRLIVFVMNPITWVEIKRPRKTEWLPKVLHRKKKHRQSGWIFG